MAPICFCTQLLIPPGREAGADTLAVNRNPSNAHGASSALLLSGSERPIALAMHTGRLWENGRVLRVKILNGSDRVKQKIRQYANEWSKYANITFNFVEEGNADIRVTVDRSGGSWCYVGRRTPSDTDPDTPTMNFGWFTDYISEDEFASTILHEFGHALGCIHEHQSPGNIPWKRGAVYEFYQRTQGWDRATVDKNIFKKYATDQTQFTAFDRDSIMLYPISAEFTTNNFSVGWNVRLSQMDKEFIGMMYPFAPASVVATGTFHTMEVRPWDEPAPIATKSARFSHPFPAPPRVAVGLCALDIDCARDICISAAAENISTDRLQLRISTPDKSAKIYSACCVWYAPGDADIQTGTFSSTEILPVGTRMARRIAFPRPYTAPPEVVVWLNRMHMSKEKNWRINAFAQDVTATGFTVAIDTWCDTVLWTGGVSWIAYPRDKPGVVSGRYNTMDVRPWDEPQADTTGRVNFPAGAFRSAPTVLIALHQLDLETGRNLRVSISVDAVSATGMDWHINTWADSILYSAGVSYLAFA